MARRIRRPSVVWLPLATTNRINSQAAANIGTQNGGFQFGVQVQPGLATGFTQAIAIVKDEPQNITQSDQTLSDIEGSAYRLRRIVGKIFIAPLQISEVDSNSQASLFMVTAGFIILRVDPAGAILSGNLISYDTQSLDNARDPWIWRRTWMVSDVAQANAQNAIQPDIKPIIYPPNNLTGYGGGNMDGPHIDAKTARVVSDEERLILVVSAIALDGATEGIPSAITVFGEVRVLASMRKQSGNRRNASR